MEPVTIKFGAVKALPWPHDFAPAPQIHLLYSFRHHAEITHPDSDSYSFRCMTIGWTQWTFEHVYEDAEFGLAVICGVDPDGIDNHYWSVRFHHDGDPRLEPWGATITYHNRFEDPCTDPETVYLINEFLDSVWDIPGLHLWQELEKINGGSFDTAPREWLLQEIENRVTVDSMELFRLFGFKNYGIKNDKIKIELMEKIENELKNHINND